MSTATISDLILCRTCARPFPYPGRGPRSGRCATCKSGLVIIDPPKKYRARIKPKAPKTVLPKHTGYNNDPKRDNQRRVRKALLEIRGVPRIPGFESYAILCDKQTGADSQYNHCVNDGFIQPHQMIGFCENPKNPAEAAENIRHNNANLPEAAWYLMDIGRPEGLNQLKRANAKTVDFDPCESLKNPWVREVLSALMASTIEWLTINSCVYNFRYGGRDYATNWETYKNLLETIVGFENWELVPSKKLNGFWYDDYHSTGRGGGQDYRTVILRRKGSVVSKVAKETRTRVTGIIVTARADKGYGFIRCDDGRGDIFVHVSKSQVPLEVGRRVSFYWNDTAKGPEASGVIGI